MHPFWFHCSTYQNSWEANSSCYAVYYKKNFDLKLPHVFVFQTIGASGKRIMYDSQCIKSFFTHSVNSLVMWSRENYQADLSPLWVRAGNSNHNVIVVIMQNLCRKTTWMYMSIFCIISCDAVQPDTFWSMTSILSKGWGRLSRFAAVNRCK